MSDKEQIDLAMALKSMRENIVAHIELQKIQAKLARQKYLALIEEGFTEAQALTLCK